MGKQSASDWDKVNEAVVDALIENEVVENGDLVVLTKGMHKFSTGGTNLMKILRVGEGDY
jgi:pyruvate kinase